MEITYVKTQKSNLNNVPLIDGQTVYVSDSNEQYLDFNGVRKRNVFGDEIEAVKNMISDTYDPALTYNKGDCCIYNDALYKCNANSTTGIWDPSKWDNLDISNELVKMNYLGMYQNGVSSSIFTPYATYLLIGKVLGDSYQCSAGIALITSWSASTPNLINIGGNATYTYSDNTYDITAGGNIWGKVIYVFRVG